MHGFKIYHGDLKLSNLWLDYEYNLVIFDTIAKNYSAVNKDGILDGLDPYKAPETFNNQFIARQQMGAIDLFAVGTILFILYFGSAPFNWATDLDIEK